MKATLYDIASYHQKKCVPKDRSESEISSWSMKETDHQYSEQFHLFLSQYVELYSHIGYSFCAR